MALAYFSTWTTYGTWLPGDPRGWYQSGRAVREPDAARQFEAALRMTGTAVVLDPEQCRLVEQTVADHCAVRGWVLHAVNCRSNHVHVVVTAAGRAIELPREQFKSWCTRQLTARQPARRTWWTERGWDVYIDDDEALADVIAYVVEGQTHGHAIPPLARRASEGG